MYVIKNTITKINTYIRLNFFAIGLNYESLWAIIGAIFLLYLTGVHGSTIYITGNCVFTAHAFNSLHGITEYDETNSFPLYINRVRLSVLLAGDAVPLDSFFSVVLALV